MDGYKRRYSERKHRSREEAEKLFLENQKCVKYTLRKMYGYEGERDEDKYQSACLGLWRACIYYDTDKNISFSTYANRCIFNQLVRDNPWNDKSAQPSCYLSDTAYFQSSDSDFEPSTIGEILPDPKSEREYETADFRDFLNRLSADEKKVANALIRGEPLYKLQSRIGKTWWWGKQQKDGIKRKMVGEGLNAFRG